MAAIALLQFSAGQLAVPVMDAVSAKEAVRPAPLKERVDALVFGSIDREEFAEADSFLKLHWVACHVNCFFLSLIYMAIFYIKCSLDSRAIRNNIVSFCGSAVPPIVKFLSVLLCNDTLPCLASALIRRVLASSRPLGLSIPVGLSLALTLPPCQDALSQEPKPTTAAEVEAMSVVEIHEALILEDRFPSASTCAQCHPKQYREWSVSAHAYAQLSPLMTAFQNALNRKNSSTAGDFCLRCHAPTAAALGEPVSMSNLDRSPAAREGITCVACHRVRKNFGKISGRYPIVEGDIFNPVYGVDDGRRFKAVLAQPEKYRVQPKRGESGRAIHSEVKPFFELRAPAFCGGVCHEVTSQAGFRTHEMLTEYKRSPAARKGITCVDCHMGTVQGRVSPFERGPVAVVGGVPTSERLLSNHLFAGPDYSIIHPGIFPHNVEASKLKTLHEWTQFDHEAGWGTDAFEDSASDDFVFPNAWESADDRYDGRDIIEEQMELLAWAAGKRLEVLRHGFGLSEIANIRPSDNGLTFSLRVENQTEGHYVPSGFDIERTVFLQITVTDSSGAVVYRSGDRDPNGDLRDAHSRYVAAGLLPHDDDLFNLHSKTYVGIIRGPERAQILAPPLSRSAMPMVRPDPRPTMLYGRNRNTRKHRTGIPVGQWRTATYTLPADELRAGETYAVEAKLVFQPVPISLIHSIQSVGFDYGMSPKLVAERLSKGAIEIWRRTASVRYAVTAEDR